MIRLRVCRRWLVGIVAGWKQTVVARLWAKPVTATHATGSGADLRRSRAQLLA